MYSIFQIDRDDAEDIEYLGARRKFWYRKQGLRYLFKAEERGTGEDWAEKVVCELAGVLGVPHVDYELAQENEGDKPIQPGVICPNVVPRPLELSLGNQLLLKQNPTYPSELGRRYGIREYTVEAVAGVVSLLDLPPVQYIALQPQGITSALGTFIGFVMLDAWVANQDRHHQNWGAIQVGSKLCLAPTFDHGASLARNLSDSERKDRLATRDRNRTVERFAERARSGFYATSNDKRTMPSIDVFRQFARHVRWV
jgi:hypothetical protein